jgi:hypothetical protein
MKSLDHYSVQRLVPGTDLSNTYLDKWPGDSARVTEVLSERIILETERSWEVWNRMDLLQGFDTVSFPPNHSRVLLWQRTQEVGKKIGTVLREFFGE